MADTPPEGETGAGKTLENKANEPATPAKEDKGSEGEVDKLRKDIKKIEMERNMLRNELDESAKAKKAAEEEKLKEKEEFRTLYEQTSSKLEEANQQLEKIEKEGEIRQESNKVLQDFSIDVQQTAQDLGITLSDTSEEAKTEFKNKLDNINKRLGTEGGVSGSNPAPSNKEPDQSELMKRHEKGDKGAFDEALQNLGSVKIQRQVMGYEDE